LLDAHVYGLAAVFVAEAVVARVVRNSISQLQRRKHGLRLMQKVVVDHSPIMLNQVWWLLVRRIDDGITENRHIVELLEHRVHITGCTEILQPREAIFSPFLGNRVI
jgi:hypothetical protein